MQATFLTLVPFLESLFFAIVVATIKALLAGPPSPWPWVKWRVDVWVFFCFCYIILFGLIKL